MTVKYSQTLGLQPKLCKKTCKSCGLDVYQNPAFDQVKKASIFWVGLSAVLFDESEEKLPLSPHTPSGALVHSVESPFRTTLSFYKTNLVKCVPLKEGKIRYPLAHEMEKCWPNFQWELENLNPTYVFLLGKMVIDFTFRKLGYPRVSLNEMFRYETFKFGTINFVPVHHPSYILVYKRKRLEEYKESLRNIILSSIGNSDRIREPFSKTCSRQNYIPKSLII